jgi:DNA-binding response OmpR family regulator
MRPTWVRDAADDEILLVEDDVDIAGMYKMGLNFAGYPVRVASTGAEALADEGEPQAIVLDLEMPDVGGLEILDTLRHRPRTVDVPVIVLSNQDDDFAEAYRRGATSCNAKYRTSPGDLLNLVGQAIRHHRQSNC